MLAACADRPPPTESGSVAGVVGESAGAAGDMTRGESADGIAPADEAHLAASPAADGAQPAPEEPGADGAGADDAGTDGAGTDLLADARAGSLDEVLLGNWTVVSSPGQTATFSDDVVRFYVNDRLFESAEWTVEAGDLYLVMADGSQSAYTLEDRSALRLTFSSAAGDPLVLERLLG